jgi:endonuclease/exonuclease/phosphatase family metal-dependent hydrolase
MLSVKGAVTVRRFLPLLFLLGGCAFAAGMSIPIEQPSPQEITIATWNLKWFFDNDTSDNQSDLARKMSAPTRQDYEWKLNAVADGIGKLKPTIIALQEIENEKVAKELAARIKEKYGIAYQVGFLRGFDTTTEQNVAILAQTGLQSVRRMRLPVTMQRNHELYKDLSKHLVAEFVLRHGNDQVKLTVMTVHLIANSGGEGERIKQGRVIHFWLRDRILAGDHVIVLGDFNCAVPPEDPSIKETGVGMARGLATPETTDDLYDLSENLPPLQRDTHASRKPLDRVLVSAPLLKSGKALVFDHLRTYRELAIRGRADRGDNQYAIPQSERDVSDHYPLVATFRWRP